MRNNYTRSGKQNDSSNVIERRSFLKGLSAATVAALLGTTSSTTAAAAEGPTTEGDGEPVIYQYFHHEWSEVEADVDLLDEAGVDAIWLPQPANCKLSWQHQATEDQEGFYEDEHPEYGHLEPHPPLGYQPVDLRNFDSPHGTEEELRSLIDACHERGIDVIIDSVLNHMASPDAPADRWGDSNDPQEVTELDWPQFETEAHFTHVPWYDYRGTIEDEQFDESLLGLANMDVRVDHVQAAQAAYLEKIADLGADGVRFDAVKHVWPWYLEGQINPLCEELGLWRVGEIWDPDPSTIQEFIDTGMNAFDFPLYNEIRSSFADGDLEGLHADDAPGVVHRDPENAVTFAQNHDTPGPNVGPGNPEGIEVDLANAFILSYPGTPHLFRTEAGADLEDPKIRDLIDVKTNHANGALIDRYPGSDVYIYEREGNLLAGINVAADDRTHTVETSWTDQTLTDRTDHGPDVTTDANGQVEITVPGQSWVMYTPGTNPPELTARFSTGTYEVEEGETASIDVSVSAGDEPVSDTLVLDVDGQREASESVSLDAGAQTTVTFTVDSSAFGPGEYGLSTSIRDASDVATLVVDEESGPQEPYHGDPQAIPGRVQAEQYDEGGEGTAYSDTTASNDGGAFRTDEGVDVEYVDDEQGTYNVGWTEAGEWIEYTVDVAEAGTHDLHARVASGGGGGAFRLEAGGTDVTGTVTVPDTGGWQSWTTVTVADVDLPAGETVVRLVVEDGGWNVNWFEFEQSGDGGSIQDGVYRLTPRHSGKALDVAGASQEEGANVHQWEYVGGENQQWDVEHLGDGEYRLLAQHSDQALAVEWAGTADGDTAVQESWNGGDHQRWTAEEVESGVYVFRNVNSGKALDVAGISTDDGANVQQWDYAGGDNQHWRLDGV